MRRFKTIVDLKVVYYYIKNIIKVHLMFLNGRGCHYSVMYSYPVSFLFAASVATSVQRRIDLERVRVKMLAYATVFVTVEFQNVAS